MQNFQKLIFLFLLLATGAADNANLNVVASTPNLGAIAEEIGGDRIRLTVLARSAEDPHFVSPRPTFIRILNRADVLIEGGAELELGWLPPLVQNARNRKILPGGTGNLAIAPHINLIDVPTGPIDRSSGDVHAIGNPHFLVDPENGRIAARVITDRFAELDPAGAELYRENFQRFSGQLDQKLEEWTVALADFQGTEVVTYHKNFNYFALRFGFEIVGEVEPLAGVEPSPRHITNLITRMRSREVSMVWIESFRPRRTAARVADQTGAVLVTLPEQVGAVAGASDYLGLFDYIVRQIVEAGDQT